MPRGLEQWSYLVLYLIGWTQGFKIIFVRSGSRMTPFIPGTRDFAGANSLIDTGWLGLNNSVYNAIVDSGLVPPSLIR